MADNDEEIPEEEQQKKKEPPKPVTWKIFLNDMNSWFSSFFIDNMRTDNKPDALNKYDFMGTTQNSKRPLPSLFTPKEIKINYNYNYESPVFENDIFVYNLDGGSFNEIDYIIKGLKALKYEKEKVLVIITSIMTWARTPPKYKKEEGEAEQENEGEGENEEKKEAEPQGEEGEKEPESEEEEYVVEEGEEENKEEDQEKKEEAEGEEVKQEPKKILLYKEKDFIKRVPSRKFYHNKMVETVALANTNPNLKTYIVCAGHIYGCGEDLFYDYFKMSWLQSPEKLPLIGKGKNVVPTIHIKDLVSLIRRVIETRPKNKYIFAIDHTKNRTLKNIITSISKGVGTGLVESFDEQNKDKIPHYEELVIDVKAKPTKLFLDEEKKDEEEDEAYEKRKFKWHCEFGIPENIEKLRQEFNEYRGMKNVKIFISGPPGSGKSYIAEKISKFYNIPHYKIKDIIDYGKKLTDELGEEIKTKLEEIDNAVKEEEENYKKRPNRKITDLPLDLSQKVKLPDEIVVKLLKRKLSMNVCKNRGYILDGYPKGYTNAHNIFFEEVENPDEPTPKLTLLQDILPNGFIRIDNCSEELILNRLKKLPDINGDPNIIERRFKRRWKAYKELNESEKGEPNLDNFFAENKVDILRVNGSLDEGKVLEKCKVFIERNGRIKNYQVFDEEFEVVEKQKVQDKVKQRNLKLDEEEIENEFYDNEKDEVKKEYNEKMKKDLAIKEKNKLEEESEILRKYLSENVIPVLSQGILHVCKELPEDPVDELAQFLFNNSNKAKFPPQKYYPQQES